MVSFTSCVLFLKYTPSPSVPGRSTLTVPLLSRLSTSFFSPTPIQSFKLSSTPLFSHDRLSGFTAPSCKVRVDPSGKGADQQMEGHSPRGAKGTQYLWPGTLVWCTLCTTHGQAAFSPPHNPGRAPSAPISGPIALFLASNSQQLNGTGPPLSPYFRRLRQCLQSPAR